MRLAGLDQEFTPVSFADSARNRVPEMTMTEAIEENLGNTLDCLAKLWPARRAYIFCGRFVVHIHPQSENPPGS
jgi:hypothetical protein